MHVTHVNFALGFRGGERQTVNLIAELAALGLQQTLVCRTGAMLKARCADLPVDIVECTHPLTGHLHTRRPDVVHVHEARGAYWAGIERLLRSTPYLITRRIPNPVSDGRCTRAVYRHASALVGVSRHVARRLAQQTGRDVGTILSAPTAHAVDVRRVADIRAMLGAGPVIGHVGALHDRHKGQSLLIEAFHLVARALPEARLLLVGSGPDRDRFVRLARNDARICFAGQQADVGPWLAAMDVFAFPSREEGLGSSVLDAMALGIPVAVSAVDGLPELIGNEERGLSFAALTPEAIADTLLRLWRDADLRERLAQAAREFAEAHAPAAMAAHYLQVYRDIIGTARPVPLPFQAPHAGTTQALQRRARALASPYWTGGAAASSSSSALSGERGS